MAPDHLTVRAPVRIDLAGGGSDVTPFAAREWGMVVNAALDRYATVTLRRRADRRLVLTSADLGVQETYADLGAVRHDTPLRLITAALAAVGVDSGLDVRVQTDVPAGSGLGASAAVSVALLWALQRLRGAVPDRTVVADAAVRLETAGLRITGGGQDQYAAAFGGLQALHFAAGTVARRPLAVPAATQQALAESLVLCYSGTAHLSGAVLAEVMALYEAGDAATRTRLYTLRDLAARVEACLIAGDLADLGALLTANWRAFRAFHPHVSTPAIEQIFALGAAHGATGGKATGAGGGGCVLLACPPSRRLALCAALTAAGFPPLAFGWDVTGVTACES